MPPSKIANDATDSVVGAIYQLYVAVEACFQMTSGQQVIIERYGDVSVSNSLQIEVKHYGDTLTDSHENFWKTLGNWLRTEFDDQRYARLILCTTQQIGTTARLRKWNDSTPSERKAIIDEIATEAEERFAASAKKDPPSSLLMMRAALEIGKSEQLKRIIPKIVIAHGNPDAGELYQRLKEIYGKGVLFGKQDDFLAGLLGYVICPDILESFWTLTYAAFTEKVLELTGMYCRGTRHFPTKFQRSPSSEMVNASSRSHLFVSKILDINYDQVVPKAITDYLYASNTVQKDLASYESDPGCYETFAQSIFDQFQPLYRKACRNLSDVVRDSQNFYDDVMAHPVPAFPGFETPDVSFRNGVIHMHLDEATRQIVWRLIEHD